MRESVCMLVMIIDVERRIRSERLSTVTMLLRSAIYYSTLPLPGIRWAIGAASLFSTT